jgi:hypothetical protein
MPAHPHDGGAGVMYSPFSNGQENKEGFFL